ncbi:MAG: S1C family serine protease [Burkholderiales bacterium]
MSESKNWAFPANLQPTAQDLTCDLDQVLDSVVSLRAEIPEDAFTASFLGTERTGSGVVISEDGLILTIGYLITEAQSIWLTANNGTVMQGHTLAYDQATGFGLIQPLGRLKLPMLNFASLESTEADDDVFVIAYGGRSHALKAKVVGKREFAGNWEYVLDEALFTAPAHPHWSGAAVIDEFGRLLGIGSLLVQEAREEGQNLQGNMFVPVDILKPILEDLKKYGKTSAPSRPWLGLYVAEADGHLVVSGITEGGPAAKAGLKPGDVILSVAGGRPTGIADVFRRYWALGSPGVEVPLTVLRKGARSDFLVRSAERGALLKKPSLH